MTDTLWRPLPLDTPVEEVTAMLLVSGSDALVATCTPNPVPGVNWIYDLLTLTQWRNSGPIPRRIVREVSRRATVESVGVAQELRPQRAFTLSSVQWRSFRSPLIQATTMRLITVEQASKGLPELRDARYRAEAQVAEVRELYGRMLTDIAYRIENSALFDSDVPLTRQFDTALALWTEVDDATPETEITRRASVVKITFDAARAHAETLGLGHLPETARDPARRAAGAARLASGTTAEAEREAAMAQVIQILDSLALYYLPKPEDFRKAIAQKAVERGS